MYKLNALLGFPRKYCGTWHPNYNAPFGYDVANIVDHKGNLYISAVNDNDDPTPPDQQPADLPNWLLLAKRVCT